MSKKMIVPPHESGVIRETLTGTVASGAWADRGTGLGVKHYLNGGVSGDVVAVALEGVFECVAETGAWIAGETLWLDADNVTFNNADTGSDEIAGIAYEDKASGVLVGKVKLVPRVVAP